MEAALDLGVPIPTIAAAVDARALSANRERRVAAEAAFGSRGARTLAGVTPDDVRAALYAAKIASYSQGFDLLACASDERGYGTDRSEVARIWKAGCIIRAGFLDRVREAFAMGGAEHDGAGADLATQGGAGVATGAPAVLALAAGFRTELAECMPSWRKVVATAVREGIPVPGLAASLAWFDTLSTSRGSANLIQAQRDYFGSHTYERVDAPGEFVHTDWAALARRSGSGRA